MINPGKQSQMLYASVSVALLQLSMLACLLYSFVYNEENQYQSTFSHSMALFYVKLPCCVALHFEVFP
jgi:hypothetical protein